VNKNALCLDLNININCHLAINRESFKIWNKREKIGSWNDSSRKTIRIGSVSNTNRRNKRNRQKKTKTKNETSGGAHFQWVLVDGEVWGAQANCLPFFIITSHHHQHHNNNNDQAVMNDKNVGTVPSNNLWLREEEIGAEVRHAIVEKSTKYNLNLFCLSH
jgi:hypothetical protein